MNNGGWRSTVMKNDVSSFFYYMWNKWDINECDIAFGADAAHLWSKYCQYYSVYGAHGAISMLYANLSEYNRDRLVERACECYEGRKYKMI